MAKKKAISVENFEQIYNYVSTYKYWQIQEGADVFFNSENKNIKFEDALDQSIDIATKRGKSEISIRVGNNERNSRFNDEIFINLQDFYNQQVTAVNLQSPQRKGFVLNGGFNQEIEKNAAGISALDMQTYLNGALDRQQKELELMSKNQSLQAVANLRAEMIEREISLKREMFNKEMEAERKLFERERQEFEKQKAKLQEEYEMTNRGLAGVFKSVASVGNEILNNGSIFGNKSKLNGKSDKQEPQKPTEKTSTVQDEDTGFEEVDNNEFEEEQEQNIDTILSGFENMNDEEIEFLQELIAERKANHKVKNTEPKNTNSDSNIENSDNDNYTKNNENYTGTQSDNKDPT